MFPVLDKNVLFAHFPLFSKMSLSSLLHYPIVEINIIINIKVLGRVRVLEICDVDKCLYVESDLSHYSKEKGQREITLILGIP